MKSPKFNYNTKPQGVLAIKSHRFNLNLEDIISIINKKLKKQKTVSVWEIGCGGGRNLEYLEHLYGKKIDLYGSDFSQTAVKYAQSKKVGQIKLGRSTQKLFNQKFDLIIILDLLEHLPDHKEASATLKLVSSQLKNGGFLYLSVPIENNPFSHTWLSQKLNLPDLTLRYYGHTIKFTNKDITDLVNRHLKINSRAYHSHLLTQLNVLFTFFLPKIIINYFGGSKLETSLRDSNIEMNKQKSPQQQSISLIRTIYGHAKTPIDILSYLESKIRHNNKFGALAVNITAHSRQSK